MGDPERTEPIEDEATEPQSDIEPELKEPETEPDTETEPLED